MQIYAYSSPSGRRFRQRLPALMLEPLAQWGDAHFVLIQTICIQRLRAKSK